jgi:phosphoenolpyruvate carboxylase
MGLRLDTEPPPAARLAGLSASTLNDFIQASPRKNLDLLREMYREWTFFHSVISNIEMTLAKADFQIANYYADIVTDKELGQRIFDLLRDEYQRTCRVILQITNEKKLLDKSPVLQRSITVRESLRRPDELSAGRTCLVASGPLRLSSFRRRSVRSCSTPFC